MARIPESELERLKREVPIERLAAARGIALKRHGADLVGLCPFHEDHEPSLVISPKKNLWHCLGACQTGGSVVDWVMRAEGVSFRHAVEILRGNPAAPASRLPPPVAFDAGDRELLLQVAAYYHETLKQSPEALAYLEKRGLKNSEMIDRFQLGFANRTLGLRLPEKNRKAGAEIRARLARLGVLRESGHEHFNGSLVIPVFDAAGQVVEIYGRKITANLREGTPLHLYLPGPHRGVWNEAALEASKEIILCEALIDALTFWCAGLRNVTASYGVNGFTEDHRAAFAQHGVKTVYIAYDRDEAGDKAAESLAAELGELGVESHRVLFPRGMDANEYAQKGSLAALLNFPPPAAKEETPVEIHGDEITMRQGDRRYRIRGLAKNLSHEVMKVNVLAGNGSGFHVDTLDLYAARQRAVFTKQASEELGVKEDVVKRDLGRVLLKLEELQDEAIRKALEPARPEVALTEAERDAALELLQDPCLLDRILDDFTRCGIVGEETNKLVGYLAAVSRHLESPLAVLIQSSSAAGKSSLMEAVLAFVPEEERVEYSAMTGQSLFYMGETDLKHKVLAIVEEEGATRAAYALKLLQSEGVLTIASTGKDPSTGRLVTHQYRVEGPVMIFLTTTAIDLDEELLNRCLVLTVNEERQQTQAIHRLQREQQTLDGLLARRDRQEILQLHRNAQRLLRPLLVANPYARDLTFLDSRTRMRRDHVKYLTLIRAIALLHQRQRPVKTERGVSYIEVTLEDIETANRLAHEVLGRSLDELPPQTRRLLRSIDEMVTQECARLQMERSDFRFSRKDVRRHTQGGDTQLKVHLHRLEELEHLLVHHGGRGQSFVYELLYQAGSQPSKPRLPGLMDVYDLEKPGAGGGRSGSSRGQVGRVSGAGRAFETPVDTGADGVFVRTSENFTVQAGAGK
jgi:DNA primase